MGVGAAPGRAGSLEGLLASAPEQEELALVLVPSDAALEHELRGRDGAMPVRVVEDGMPLEPGHAYVVPHACLARLDGGSFRLEQAPAAGEAALPVDTLFESIARERGARSVGVVLSGSGPDGIRGIQAIKEAGGMTVAEASSPGAPHQGRSATQASGEVDAMVPLAGIWDAVVPYARHPYVRSGRVRALHEAAPDQYRGMLDVLRAHTDHDFTDYKSGTLTRRIERRMGIRHLDDPADYLAFLRESPEEVMALYRDLLIGVTGFFRDAEAWTELEGRLAELLRARGTGGSVRIWVAGCATGEEAYAMAILLADLQERLGVRVGLQIFATDVDAQSVAIARLGLYPEHAIRDVPERLRDLAFRREGNRVRIRKRVREACVFAVQNLLSDPPFSHVDVISCRNLLIYIEPPAQARILEIFHAALNEEGLLFLGGSESPERREGLFDPVSRASSIYRRAGDARTRRPIFALRPPPGMRHARGRGAPGPGGRTGLPRRVAERSKEVLVDDFAPPSVVVTGQGAVEYIHGAVRDYLDFPAGEPSLDLPSMLLQGLGPGARSALRRARETGETVSIRTQLQRAGETVPTVVRVRPLGKHVGEEDLYLVSFYDVEAAPGSPPPDAVPVRAAPSEGLPGEELALELEHTREDLQRTVEELESANEELTASHEEAMSMNEELQSANEELETSREELQSLNEELNTVNTRLREKVDELERTSDDLLNFLVSTDVATVFLDADLRIRRFTPAMQDLVSLRPSDLGRPLDELSMRVPDPELVADARRTLESHEASEKEIAGPGDEQHRRRITPFRTGEDEIAGVVVTYTDITSLKRAIRRGEVRERQQAVTAELGRMALGTTDLQKVFDRTVEELAVTLGVDYTKVLRLEEGRALRVVAGVGWDEGIVGRATVAADERSQAGYTIQTGGPVITSDLTGEERFQGPTLLTDHGVRSGMSVVIGANSDPWGILGVHSRQARRFTPDDANFLAAVANLLADAIERKASEQRLGEQLAVIDALYQSAPIGLCYLDTDLRFRRINQELADMNGAAIEDHMGRTVEDAMPHLAPRVVPLLRRVLETGEPRMQVEVDVPGRDDREELQVRLASYTPVVSGGRVIGINAAVQDITDRRRAERALEEARARAEDASEAKTRFLANMSHEIRSPLTAVLGYAELLDVRLAGSDDHALLHKIRQNGDHLRQILDDILDLAKIESDTMDSHIAPTPLSEPFAYVRSLMSARATEKGLDFRLTFDGPVPEAVVTDARMLRQILINLVGNAVKFTEEGEVEVGVRCDVPAERLEIRVADTGPGIHEDRQEAIFQPFEQVDTSATREAGGTGLGLAITRRLVEILGGTLALDSRPGQGSTFTVSIPTGPLERVRLLEVDGSLLGSERDPGDLVDLPPLSGRVLVVEDRPDIRDLIREILEGAGCEVLTAEDGAAGVDRWKTQTRSGAAIDLVLMDIQMPRMDGITAFERLREAGCEVPVIALTAGVMTDERDRCLSAGFDHFVSKPVDARELVSTLAPRLRAEAGTTDGLSVLAGEDHADAAWMQEEVLKSLGHRVRTGGDAHQVLETARSFRPDVVLLDLSLVGMSTGELVRRLKEEHGLQDARYVCLSGRSREDVDWKGMGFHVYLQKPAAPRELDAALRGRPSARGREDSGS